MGDGVSLHESGVMKNSRLRKKRAPSRRSATGVTRRTLTQSPPKVPDHLLLRCVGRGGFGEVWLAKSILGTFRAVKIVRRSSFYDKRPFDREFEGLKRFEPISRSDPGFISILHVGRNHRLGYFYAIMELADDAVSGQAIRPGTYEPRTLASDLSRRHTLPIGECLEIGLSLAGTLKHLHRHGLVHRDVKPSNIIFVNGIPRLADIGLVTAIDETKKLDGTPGYAPPEGAGGPTADLYSLGKLLYQISTGKRPERFPELPTGLTEGLVGPQFARFNDILLRACAQDPQKRYPSAEAMRAALGQCRRAGEGSVKPGTESGPGSNAGERRLLTALCIQISRTERADPEEVQRFMETCVDSLRPVLQRYGGTIAQNLSDGLMVVFGGPNACEDHVVRAVHAAIEIRQTLETQRPGLESSFGFGFEARFGLSTGLGIFRHVGRNHPPSGDVIDLASRIAPHLDAGQIGVTDAAYKAVKDYFLMRALGERRLLANASPMPIYEAAGTRAGRTRIEAEAERGFTPLVGRSKELTFLRERLTEARSGQGQVVLVAGEAGVGKSRLLLEFQRLVGSDDICWLAGRSFSFGSQMAYLPVIDLVKRGFRIEDTDDSSTICARVEAEIQALGEGMRSALPLVKHLLSIGTPDDGVIEMDSSQRRVKTFEVVRNLVLKRAEHGPVILAVEDLHWIDKTSEEFLVLLADSLSMASVLMLLTYRPEYRNQFPERSFVSRLALRQLNDQESLQMASRILDVDHLPDHFKKRVLGKAEGNPFFLEEMIKSMLESGALRIRNGAYEMGEAARGVEVPATIQDVIMSRIDHLEESPRKALQLASVIGREFGIGLLETMADLNEPLAESLRKLKGLELIYERSVFPEHTCYFKHALTQEVAYNSLLLQRRKELHCLVAAAIEELYGGRLAEYYGLLAYHYERGEEWERALDYLRRAAERSRGISAYREEAFQIGRAIAVAQRLGHTDEVSDLRGQRGVAWVKVGMCAEARPELESALVQIPPEKLERRAELLSSLAAAWFWALDIPGTQRCAADAHTLAEKVGRNDLVAGSLAWLGAGQQAEGDLVAATELFERSLARGAGHCSAALANYPLALYLSGRITEALEEGRKAVDAFRSLTDTFAATFGHPHFGLALAARGLYADAARVFEEAKQMGEKHDVWIFHARAVAMSAGFHLDVFDFRGHERIAEEACERAHSANFLPSVVSASLDLVFNLARRGEVGRAEKLAEKTSADAARIGGWHQWLWQLRLRQAKAEIACARTNWVDALERATEAVSDSRARGRPKYWALGLETRARSLLSLGRKQQAVRDLRKAVSLARKIGDPALFLRAATTLLGVEGSDKLLLDTRQTARRILENLPDADMRRQFEAAEPVRRLGSLSPPPTKQAL
jgi:class 3 adenylate cyclase/tetratricopeptide (TPR) repeat protein